ncbi:MAG TPA: TonB-dependent receptor [Steroidobacteraceae bacterium]|jgi:iron complex outermembrane receptor protein|nr:TonB-dependent receptor [Steroidobacteraceae bacterium]
MNGTTTHRPSPRNGAHRNLIAALCCAGAVAGLTAKATAADDPSAPQSTPDQPAAAEQIQEVVVTGTLIRNVAPVGSTLIAMDQEQLQQTGASSLADALRTLPQVDNLGVSDASRSGTGGAGNIVYGNSINLRGLSPFATLTLVDGHRVPPGGTTGSTVDPDAFPALMLQRVDIVADGASATYGSDAIAGVVNLILRRNVEGVDVEGKYGFANGYEENREGLMAGHNWGSGQFSIGFEENYHSDLNGQDRSFFESNQTAEGGTDYATQQCNPGTIVVGTTTYAIPKGGVTPATAAGLIPGTANYCDLAKYQDILPRVRHSNVAFTLDQKLGDRISVFADGTYSKRTFLFLGAAPTGPLQVPSSNAFFVAPPGTAPTVETVNYSFANDLGPYSDDIGASTNFQGTLGVKADLGHDWQLQLDGTAGRDRDYVYDPPNSLVNGNLASALASGNPATALNVYGAGNAASVIDSIFSGIFYGPGFSREQVLEAQVDGGLFALPGGEVRLAFGGQWRHDELEYGLISGPVGAQLNIDEHLSRHSDSAFAEVLIPLVGSDNALPGIQRLDLDVAGRYEDYSDFGSTSHPKIGLNWTPSEGVMVHASYGTSFRAPLLSELVGPLRGVFVQTYSDPLAPSGTSVGYTLGGGNLALKPETATTFSAGIDFAPTAQSKISLTYYNINYKNQIASYLSDLTILQQTGELGGLVTRCPSAACTALVSQYTSGPGALPILGPPLANPSVFVNGEEENLGATKTQGLDLVGGYGLQTPLPGKWSVDLAANLTTQYDVQFTPGGAYFNVLNTIGYPLRLRLRGDVGWAYGPFTTKLFVNFVNGYQNTETTPTQSVSSYVTEDLDVIFNASNVLHWGLARDLTFTFHVTNIGNVTPPYVNIPIGDGGGGYDATAANPLGRVISVGFGKKF